MQQVFPLMLFHDSPNGFLYSYIANLRCCQFHPLNPGNLFPRQTCDAVLVKTCYAQWGPVCLWFQRMCPWQGQLHQLDRSGCTSEILAAGWLKLETSPTNMRWVVGNPRLLCMNLHTHTAKGLTETLKTIWRVIHLPAWFSKSQTESRCTKISCIVDWKCWTMSEL